MTFQLLQAHKQDCKTPHELYRQLNEEFNFTFDPCPLNPEFNGLNIDWYGRVFVNPPYNNIPKWLEKAHRELEKGNCEVVVFLLPVDTSTRWFHDYIIGQAEIRFIKGRLRFYNDRPAPFASMVVIFRKEVEK